jgi:aminopeptidase N
MQWWNDLWLNEGFASFVEYIGADRVNPDWKMMDQFVVDSVVRALYKDSLTNSHPISMPVDDPAEINEIFDAISYSKGASIIRMLEGFLGQDILQAGLKNYLVKFKYSNAKTDDLWEVLAEESEKQLSSKIDVKGIMDTWTLQQGYPVVMVSLRDGSVVAQQSQFTLNPHGMQEDVISPFGYIWKIPLNYVTNESPQQASEIIWLETPSNNFKVHDQSKWIKLNVNFTGYYRVHYDENNWKALTTQLQENHLVFSASDRAELIDDVFALSRAALMSANTALNLIRYLNKELEYVPWSVAIENLADVSSMLQGTSMNDNFKQYFMDLVSPVLEFLGWDHQDSYLKRKLRSNLLKSAVAVNYKPAVEKCQEKFRDWMLRNISVLPEYKLAVYAAGIQYGGEEEWQFLWRQYQQSIVPTEKRHLLKSLAKTTDASRLERYLQMSLDESEIRKQDTVSVLAGIANSAAGRTLAWNFVKRNWKEFDRRYSGGSFEMSNLITAVTAFFTSEYDYTDIQSFFTSHTVSNAKRAVSQSLERIQMNIDWLDRNEKSMSEWLEQYSTGTNENDIS